MQPPLLMRAPRSFLMATSRTRNSGCVKAPASPSRPSGCQAPPSKPGTAPPSRASCHLLASLTVVQTPQQQFAFRHAGRPYTRQVGHFRMLPVVVLNQLRPTFKYRTLLLLHVMAECWCMESNLRCTYQPLYLVWSSTLQYGIYLW